MTEAWDDATENTEVQELDLAHNYWELHVVQEGQREFRYPFFEVEMDLGQVAAGAFPGGAPWTVTLTDSGITLLNRESGQCHTLAVGENLELEGRRLWLIDVRKPPVGTIEGVTPPFAGRVWHIKGQQAWLGRRGKRLNHIELDHPTVSRTHATLLPDSTGRVNLLCETSSPTTINGHALQSGESKALTHGDLLGLGQLHFRFSTQSEATNQEAPLYLQTLGGFRASVGSESAPEIVIKSEKARWLLAYVASRWEHALPAEPMIEAFWPGVERTRGRKNLSYTLSQLKESFQDSGVELEGLLLRSPSELRLNPDRLGAHDYVEVKRLVSPRQALSSESVLTRLLKLYKGPFLDTCYEPWADELKSSLQQDLQDTLLQSAQHFLKTAEHGAVRMAAEALLSLDELNEEGALCLVESALLQAQPERAISVYERMEANLRKDGLEPAIELVKAYHRARLGL